MNDSDRPYSAQCGITVSDEVAARFERTWQVDLPGAYQPRHAKPEPCIHPDVFARGPVPGTEYCGRCDRDIPREEL